MNEPEEAPKLPSDDGYERPEARIPTVEWEDRAFEALYGPDGAVAVWVDVDPRPPVGFVW